MNAVDGKPATGGGAAALGVRVPRDVIPNTDGSVSPGHAGMSVSPSVAALNRMPARMVPSRLRTVVPGAAGRDDLSVWSLGGEWDTKEQSVSAGLLLRADPADPLHGFVEPDSVMPLTDYRAALEATQDFWRVDKA